MLIGLLLAYVPISSLASLDPVSLTDPGRPPRRHGQPVRRDPAPAAAGRDLAHPLYRPAHGGVPPDPDGHVTVRARPQAPASPHARHRALAPEQRPDHVPVGGPVRGQRGMAVDRPDPAVRAGQRRRGRHAGAAARVDATVPPMGPARRWGALLAGRPPGPTPRGRPSRTRRRRRPPPHRPLPPPHRLLPTPHRPRRPGRRHPTPARPGPAPGSPPACPPHGPGRHLASRTAVLAADPAGATSGVRSRPTARRAARAGPPWSRPGAAAAFPRSPGPSPPPPVTGAVPASPRWPDGLPEPSPRWPDGLPEPSPPQLDGPPGPPVSPWPPGPSPSAPWPPAPPAPPSPSARPGRDRPAPPA